MSKILITGGTGLVGAHLLYKLSLTDNEIFATKQNSSDINRTRKIFAYYTKQYKTLFNKINWIDADISNYANISENIHNINEIYHCAAFISYRKQDREKMYDINVEGTANLVNYALEKKVEKFCYVSSIASFGVKTDDSLINETTDWEDSETTSVYSKTKFYAEEEVWRGIAEGLNAVIVNPSVILGAGNWDSSSSVIFPTIEKGLKFYTKGITGFVNVNDVVNIMIELMTQNIFNKNFILSSENFCYKDLFNLIAKSIKVKSPTIYANKVLTGFAWRLEFIKSLLFNRKAVITKQSATTAHKILKYSNKKIKTEIDYNFITIENTIKEIGKIYLQDKKN